MPEEGSKPELRKRFRSMRDRMDPAEHERASEALRGRLEAFCVSRRIRRIGAFWPLGSEVDLRPLFAARTQWLWFFPRVVSTDPPRLAWGTEPLQPGLWGFMEPVLTQHFTPPVDLLLVPGLAFDAEGYRLGYGKGFYDALLARLEDRMPVLGVGFDRQRIPYLPREPRDLPMQGLITESRLEWFEDGCGTDGGLRS